MSTNLTSRKVKRTRKVCSCSWCDEVIHPGTPSVYETWITDGDFGSGRYHPECRKAIDRWFKRADRYDDFPEWPQNRGGIEERGEPEYEPRDMPENT